MKNILLVSDRIDLW